MQLLRTLLLAGSAAAVALPNAQDDVNFSKRGLFGPIDTSNPAAVAGGSVQCAGPPVSSFFAGLNPPYPTNSWWASYAATPGNEVAAGPYPYESSMGNTGFMFGVSTQRQFDGTSIKQPTQMDILASFKEHQGSFSNHKAIAFDTQTVTVQYFQGSATMTTYLVPGSPYITLSYQSATPYLNTTNGGISSFNGNSLAVGASSTATGTEFTVTDTTGTTYIIYSLSTITLTAKSVSSNSGTITASSTFNGVLRLVKLNSPSHKALLDQFYQTYPTSMSLDYSFTDTTGTLIYTWNTVGTASSLLMLTWPHHRLSLQNPNYPATTALSYLTTKGYMYPIIGNQWNLLYSLTSISWDAPRAVDPSCMSNLIQGLEYEISQLTPSSAPVPVSTNVHVTTTIWKPKQGGALSAAARLALIADNVGREDLVQTVITYLETSFAYWFESTASTQAAYETTWGGIVDKAGATNVNIDFGNGYYNDHHFHYGYFLHVAAIIAKFDSNWLNQHKTTINYFARDIINPSSQDPYFPITRCRDWFAGHSWASGIANGAGSRDQESTGEAINGYYGALLWASVALSQDVATEQQGAQTYWHLYPSESTTARDNPYPEASVRSLITMGNVEDWQSGAWLFWGSEKVEISSIQILPLTPVGEVTYDSAWATNVWSYTNSEMVDPTISDDWKCLIIAAYSNANPQVAAQWSANISDWGSGNTYSNELYFISTRPNPSGQPICSSVPSNPYGNYTIQAVSTGNYVAASSSNTNLVASATSASGAAVFNSAYLPNAGTLELLSNNMYVTADSSGDYALAATRATASTWEQYVIRQKIGAASGVYSIKAVSNGYWVTLGSDGSLLNNAATEAASAGFKFIAH
ncbi:glycosyl hydrolase family 81-domain-containing protein [Xylariaceae sp. FL0255]|nr:glycosyl hydrolase family 81-domain-containing protein [Xylariaceae sp. FL0255]